jgi:hypothetical protein
MVSNFPVIRQELENHIRARTGRRVRNLHVELFPERIVLRGQVNTFYLKQLAQHGAREVLPNVRLENAIEVA